MTVLLRLKAEHKDLQDKFEKLSAALQDRALLSKLPMAQINLMRAQRGVQGQYLTILTQRIKLVEANAPLAPQDATRAQPAKAATPPKAKAEAKSAAPTPEQKKKPTRTKKKASPTGSEAVE